MVESIWSILPPLLAIIMVLLTRRVLLSLGIGIITAALFIAEFNIFQMFNYIYEALKAVLVENGTLNTWNMYIIFFILLLGMMTTFITVMGGTRAFGDKMITRVKTRVGAQIMTFLIGIALFIDDYFNSLTVGQIARPITDKHRVSRAKLAYIVDSTSAPICVIAPISSWGAYILGLIGTVFMTHNIVDYSELTAFIIMIPMNYYVWSALGVVLVIAIQQVDFGPMKTHESHAIKTGELTLPDSETIIEHTKDEDMNKSGSVFDLILPIIVLFIATFFFIFWTGYHELDGQTFNLIDVFGEADVSSALFYSGIIAMLVTLILFIRHARHGRLKATHFTHALLSGLKSMMPAVLILIFAWTISDLIDQLGTGTYLANLVQSSNISFALLPFIVFIMAGIIAFSTGTSWGAFALLLPIAGQIAVSTSPDLLLSILAAVLAGAVFGDHCSPISDTTILSATGSNCHHIDHVVTQLPYALVAAFIAGLGYLVLGFTGSVSIGLVVIALCLLSLFFILKKGPSTEETF